MPHSPYFSLYWLHFILICDKQGWQKRSYRQRIKIIHVFEQESFKEVSGVTGLLNRPIGCGVRVGTQKITMTDSYVVISVLFIFQIFVSLLHSTINAEYRCSVLQDLTKSINKSQNEWNWDICDTVQKLTSCCCKRKGMSHLIRFHWPLTYSKTLITLWVFALSLAGFMVDIVVLINVWFSIK